MKKGEVQVIKHMDGYKSIHPIFDELERLYSDLSNVDSKKQLFLQPYDSVFLPILKTFEERTGYKFAPMIFEKRTYEPLKLPQMDTKNIIVCYSGGKDSFAVIRHYQKKGYNVYAYHIRGLNKTYYDEWETAEKMAEELGIPLYIDNSTFLGSTKTSLTSSGLALISIEQIIPLTQTDLPEPVAPAISICGVFTRSIS